MNLKGKVISIDFDGTIVKHAFPDIGEPLPFAFETMLALQAAGARLVLNTCREDEPKRKYLTEAIRFCAEKGLEFVSHNENTLDDDFREKGPRRKVFAHVYIDDRNFGGFPGWEAIGKVLLDGYVYSGTINDVESHKRFKERDEKLEAGETKKAHEHRLRDGWFDKYAPEDQPGIDIGCQYDPLNQTFRRYDLIFGDSDAQQMEGIADESFFTVYASNILEHIRNPAEALLNWWRILKPGGHLIVMVPHRDRYEKRKTLPSRFNHDHKWFFLPEESEAPCTIGLVPLLAKVLPDAHLVSLTTLDEGYEETAPDEHPVGEYSIEVILKKPLPQIDPKNRQILPMCR
jgi:hypothetical protein